MFSNVDLLTRREDYLKRVSTVPALWYQAATQPEAGRACICRAAPDTVEDAAHFWVSARIAAFGRNRLFRTFEHDLCRRISRQQFNMLIASCFHGLQQPNRLPLHPAKVFVDAMQMEDEWNRISAVAAWTDELIAFFWYTTA